MAQPQTKPTVVSTPTPKATKMSDDESHAKFVELANARVGRALEAIDSLGNLASPVYVKRAGEVEKIQKALEDALEVLDTRFREAKPPRKARANIL